MGGEAAGRAAERRAHRRLRRRRPCCARPSAVPDRPQPCTMAARHKTHTACTPVLWLGFDTHGTANSFLGAQSHRRWGGSSSQKNCMCTGATPRDPPAAARSPSSTVPPASWLFPRHPLTRPGHPFRLPPPPDATEDTIGSRRVTFSKRPRRDQSGSSGSDDDSADSSDELGEDEAGLTAILSLVYASAGAAPPAHLPPMAACAGCAAHKPAALMASLDRDCPSEPAPGTNPQVSPYLGPTQKRPAGVSVPPRGRSWARPAASVDRNACDRPRSKEHASPRRLALWTARRPGVGSLTRARRSAGANSLGKDVYRRPGCGWLRQPLR